MEHYHVMHELCWCVQYRIEGIDLFVNAQGQLCRHNGEVFQDPPAPESICTTDESRAAVAATRAKRATNAKR